MRPFKLNPVRLVCLSLALSGGAFIDDLAAAEIEPYEARVTAARALVLSGPGEKFYPTGTLSPGDVVEVYREEGDWLGVRPPRGSYSLVSEKELTSRNGDLAEVREDNVASRIGSQLSDKRNAVQVRLKKGEVVEILGQQSIDGDTWYKIAPPAGEFRWIHTASVERRGLIPESTSPQDEPTEVVPAAASSDGNTAKSDANKESTSAPAAIALPEKDEAWRASATPPATTPSAVTPIPEVAPPPLVPVTPDATPSANSATTAPPPSPPTSSAATVPTPVGGIDLPRQLTDIEMRLSRMASAPPQLWNTERLERDAEQVLAQAKTPAERDAVKVTLAKIDQFTALARRYHQGAGSGDPRTTGGRLQADQVSPSPSLPVTPSGFDAVGILRPVVSKRPGAPQFALVDDRGQVVTFVSPTPDVNLQPYLGRRVGIAGNRGFIPEFNRSHVTAGRVTPLAQGMMR
jgi:hypothetical protein